jgi:hypothetical protein
LGIHYQVFFGSLKLLDYYADTSLASSGLGLMAVTGAIAAQFFNLSVGWALGLIRNISKSGDVYFDLYGLKAVDNDVSTSNTSVYAIVLIVYCSVTLIAVISFPQFTR